jgi:hypothetical protein
MHERRRELLEEFGKSSLYFGTPSLTFKGDTRTFMHFMSDLDLFDSQGEPVDIYYEVGQVFYCPFCGIEL